jgi:CRISPR-associated protein Cas5d
MKGFCLEVWGENACFTRPEMKVERVSYDVITPSAARAIFEAILWKPAIVWNIKKIEVLNPIKRFSIRRNEIAFPAKDEIAQRATLCLRDVKYRISGEIIFIEPESRLNSRNILYPHTIKRLKDEKPEPDEKHEKYHAMFQRRASKGQCFNQPYFGCREFSANFKLVDPEIDKAQPIKESKDFGYMLYDLDFTDLKSPKPLWFKAEMIDGVINIPAWDSKEVLR